MSHVLADIARSCVAPIAVPLLLAKRARSRERVIEVGRRHGLEPTRDSRVNQQDRRMVGRVNGHVVIVGCEVFPRINVLMHWHRTADIGFGRSMGERSIAKWFDTGNRRFDRRFRTRFIDPAVVARIGEDRFHELMGEFAAFADRWHRRLRDLTFEPNEIQATLRYFPFVPAVDPEVLDGMLPGLVALATRAEATFGRGDAHVEEREYLGTDELPQVGPSPVSTVKPANEFAKLV